MAPFCMESLDKEVAGGRGEAARGTLPGGTGPAYLRQQAGSCGRKGTASPVG